MRALPTSIIDVIRDGVPPSDLASRGERAVWAALLRTAASAVQRGWTRPEWTALVAEPGSHLGTQAQLKRGTKPRTAAEFARSLDRAWTKAERWVAEQPAAFGPLEIVAAVREVLERVVHPDAELDDTARKILVHACTVAERNMTTRPALPWRAIVAETGLSERVVKTALSRMHDEGLLHLEVRGQGHATKRRASLYRLPAPEAVHIPVPASGSVGRPAQVYGTPEVDEVGTREQVYGTSRRVRLVIEADDADSLNQVLDRLAQSANVVAVEDDDAPDNVRPLRVAR